MANDHGHKSDEKIVYVGDSRVRQRSSRPLPRDYSAYPGKSEAFIPNFLLKEWMVGAVVLVGILVLVVAEPAPLGYPADPTNTSFIPMPDWYFLFLYQLLKYPYTSDAYVVLGTIGIPGIAFGALLLAPFLDTGKERRFYKRPIASSLMFLSLIAIIYLTRVSWAHYQEELKANGIVPEHIEREEKARQAIEAGKPRPNPMQKEPDIVNPDDPAMEMLNTATCLACHGNDLTGASGPSLRGVGDRLDKEEILNIIYNGQGNMPAMADAAKDKGLTDADIEHIADWLAQQKAE
jgi:menaquinol-cytochrome c reductase cytochrome b/c subunit